MNAFTSPHSQIHTAIAAGRAPRNVVIAYDSIIAAQQAMDAMDALNPRKSPGAKFVRVSTWWFRFLEDAALLDKATAAAVEADILVIAANIGVGLSESVKFWLCASLANNHRSGLTVVALLGEEDRQDRLDSPRFQFVQRIAKEAGAYFLSPFSKNTDRGRLVENE